MSQDNRKDREGKRVAWYLNSWGELVFLHGVLTMASIFVPCAQSLRTWISHPGREDSVSMCSFSMPGPFISTGLSPMIIATQV